MAYFDPVSSVFKSVFDAGTVVIASGVAQLPVIPTGAETILVLVDTEAAAASDTLDSFNTRGHIDVGTRLIVRSVASARDIIVNSAAVTAIALDGGQDVTLGTVDDFLMLYRNSSAGWQGRSSTPDASLSPRELRSRTDAARNLVDDTSTQAIFAAADDTLTVEAGSTYEFKLVARLVKGANAVSANTLFGGTATFTTINYVQHTGQAASGTAVAEFINNCEVATACVGNAGTGVNYRVVAEGEFEVNAAGTIIPSVAFSGATGATPAVSVGSYFIAKKIGGNPVTNIGPWA